METPQEFWAADCGDTWVKCDSKEQALAESAQYLRKPHAMRMRRMKLSELLELRASESILHSNRLLDSLSESDGDVPWCFNHECNPLGEDVHEEDLGKLVETGFRAMMAEADRRELVCDGCILLEEVCGEEQEMKGKA